MKEKSLKLEISNGFLIGWGYALWGAACIENRWDVRAVSVARPGQGMRERLWHVLLPSIIRDTELFPKVVCKYNL